MFVIRWNNFIFWFVFFECSIFQQSIHKYVRSNNLCDMLYNTCTAVYKRKLPVLVEKHVSSLLHRQIFAALDILNIQISWYKRYKYEFSFIIRLFVSLFISRLFKMFSLFPLKIHFKILLKIYFKILREIIKLLYKFSYFMIKYINCIKLYPTFV